MMEINFVAVTLAQSKVPSATLTQLQLSEKMILQFERVAYP